jgi:hypothetical protein
LWWKFLKKKKVVKADIFDSLKEDLPRIRENTRPKMISEEELKTLFKTFDSELERKITLPEFDPERVQQWFKPIVVLYFYGRLRIIAFNDGVFAIALTLLFLDLA